MIRKWIYKKIVHYYALGEASIELKFIARLLEALMGFAVFNYGGVKLTAGPYALLDNFIIRGININPFVTSALSQYLNEGGVFLDIGANHGVFSLLAARNPKIKVFAFEPSPRELKRLWKNLTLNPQSNVSVLSYGLGAEEKEQVFALSGSDNPGKNSLPAIYENGKLVTCRFSLLTHLLSPAILQQTRVCKLDVEGQEMFILNSLKPHMDLFKQCVFIIEMSPYYLAKVGFTTDDIYTFFAEAGFVSQFGNPGDEAQWEEFFYHPHHSFELIYSEGLGLNG